MAASLTALRVASISASVSARVDQTVGSCLELTWRCRGAGGLEQKGERRVGQRRLLVLSRVCYGKHMWRGSERMLARMRGHQQEEQARWLQQE